MKVGFITEQQLALEEAAMKGRDQLWILSLISLLGKLLNDLDFFAWKIAVMDFILDLIINDVSSSIDQNLGMDQLIDAITSSCPLALIP